MFKKVLFSLIASTSFLLAGNSVYIQGIGTLSCGSFLDYTKDSKKDNEIFKSYIVGIATGKDMEDADNKPYNYLKGYNIDDLLKVTKNYCIKNPLDLYFSSVLFLFEKLKDKPNKY